MTKRDSRLYDCIIDNTLIMLSRKCGASGVIYKHPQEDWILLLTDEEIEEVSRNVFEKPYQELSPKKRKIINEYRLSHYSVAK